MITKEAIDKAMEGRWKKDGTVNISFWYHQAQVFPQKIALDPTFWQALGRALEWTNSLRCPLEDCGKPFTKLKYGMESWMFFANRFSHLILTGGDTTSFWEEIL